MLTVRALLPQVIRLTHMQINQLLLELSHPLQQNARPSVMALNVQKMELYLLAVRVTINASKMWPAALKTMMLLIPGK